MAPAGDFSCSSFAKEPGNGFTRFLLRTRKTRLLTYPILRRPSHHTLNVTVACIQIASRLPREADRDYSGATASDSHRLPFALPVQLLL